MSKAFIMPEAPTANQIEAALIHLSDINPSAARKKLAQIYATFVDMRPEEMPSELTRKQAQTLEVIAEFKTDHKRNPTQQELSEILGVDRKAVRQRMDCLKRKGFIATAPGHRKIKIIKKEAPN